MFCHKGKSTRQVVIKTIMNTKIIEGTPIRKHLIHMIELFNEMKIHEVEITGETKVNMILEILLNSFRQFNLNYYMNKMLMNLPELRGKSIWLG